MAKFRICHWFGNWNTNYEQNKWFGSLGMYHTVRCLSLSMSTQICSTAIFILFQPIHHFFVVLLCLSSFSYFWLHLILTSCFQPQSDLVLNHQFWWSWFQFPKQGGSLFDIILTTYFCNFDIYFLFSVHRKICILFWLFTIAGTDV